LLSAETPVISARGLRRVYGQGAASRAAVDGVDLTIGAREIVLIFGPSGCGKSTLLALLGGLDRSYTGKLRLFDRPVEALSDSELSELRGARIGFVFQAFHLLPHMSVLDNVGVPALFSRRPDAAERASRRSLEVLERVGLADRAQAFPDQLSGGQRQRVAIARALLHEPELLLCDEPTGNLDRQTGEQIVDLFSALHRSSHTTIVIVTHEERVTRIAHRKLEMVDGRLREMHDGAASA
jgi:putative ABC transport system ATP-binding protein